MMQLKNGTDIKDINVATTLSYLKPIHAQWVMNAYDKVSKNKPALLKGWELMGLSSKQNTNKTNSHGCNDVEKQQ